VRGFSLVQAGECEKPTSEAILRNRIVIARSEATWQSH
jgi:hypothetical protein